MLNETAEQLEETRKQLKLEKAKKRRLQKKVSHLSTVVDSLQQEGLISENCAEILQKSFSGVPLDLMQRILQKSEKTKCDPYSEELKAFAMTLQFYSAKAYDYVRETFDLALPSPRLLRTWYAKVDGEPGFTKQAFDAMKTKVEMDISDGRKTICALMFDEMSIRKHLEFSGGRYHGFVDIGNGQTDDSMPLAKDALVFMAVSLNSHWKVPLGYFLIDGLTGKERANLVRECLHMLNDVGVTIVSLTCDGPSCHLAMLTDLGASMKPDQLRPSFPNPADPETSVHVMLDACHMLKLVRNAFGDGAVHSDGKGQSINWGLIDALHDVQESEGLRLGNKVKESHIEWRKQKMKVSLAAQVISASVADAIEYCAKELILPEFSDYQGTVHFLRTFDKVFDLLNSRNPCAKGLKAPMTPENKRQWLEMRRDAKVYILSLMDEKGQRVVDGKRKTGFVGFLACLESVENIYMEQIERKNALKYLLTYKLSQDHIELFFSSVRARGGFNNNPTVLQFKAAYKRLLVHHNVRVTGNCQIRDQTDILYVTSRETVGETRLGVCRKYDMLENIVPADIAEEQCGQAVDAFPLSEFKESAIAYIAGYVVKMAAKRLHHCQPCIKALTDPKGRSHPFVLQKDRGWLQKASESVIRVCSEAEICLDYMMKATGGELPTCNDLTSVVSTAVLYNLSHLRLFPELKDHMFDTTVTENHVHLLTKLVAECFAKIKLHHLGKRHTEKSTGPKIRKKLSKLILFKHQ